MNLIKPKFLAILLLTACGSTSNTSSSYSFQSSDSNTIYINTHKGCSASNASGSSGSRFETISFPGNAAFRRHFYRNASKISDLFLGDSFEEPDILFYDDEGSPNAWAIGAASRYEDPKIVLGQHMIQLMVDPIMTGGSGFNTAALTSVVAHEYAHLVQFELNARGRLRDKELMADTLSGYYSAHGLIAAQRYDFSREVASTIAYQLSNSQRRVFNSGDYKFADRNHHGTPQQRLRAFNAGVEFALQQSRRSGSIYRDHDDFLDAVDFAAELHDVYID